jgi:predicted transport protein
VKIDELQDPKKLAKIWIKKNESTITMSKTDQVPYVLTLIKQAFEKD